MLRLGIIGTNWITDQFLEAVNITKQWQLTTVYSRTEKRAAEYAQAKGAQEFFTDLNEFFEAGSFDVVYIASPNSLHYEQVRQAIENDKYVIVEKPAFVNPDEFAQIESVLKAHPQARLVEAARHIHTPLFGKIKAQVKQLNPVQGATITFMKYSSRYDQVLNHETPNVFSQKFAGGALQDLGVYPVYFALALFGQPQGVVYFPTMIETGVDGKGVAILQYADFEVTLNFGKNANSHLPSEIYGLKDTLVLDNPADLTSASYFTDKQDEQPLTANVEANSMVDEVRDFGVLFDKPLDDQLLNKYQEWFDLSRLVNETMYQLRQSAQIEFPSDTKE